MAKINALTHLFNTGRISRAALNRIDKESIRLFAEQQDNILPYSIGKAIMRPGTRFLGETAGNTRARLIPFAKSPTARALLELTNGILRVWVDDELVTRPTVTAVVGGDLTTGAGWTETNTGSANTSFGSGGATLFVFGKGGSTNIKQEIPINEQGTVHALNIQIAFDEVTFICGSTDGADDLIAETVLGPGLHSLAFTPSTSSVWIRFSCDHLRAGQVRSCVMASAGPMAIGSVAWGTSNIRNIRWQQSLDVVFIANLGIKPLKIERRGDESWSVVDYLPFDGPFALARDKNVTLTPGGTTGSLQTLTASAPYFSALHVGQLFQLTHENTNQTTPLSGLDEVTNVVRVVGIRHGSAADSDRNVDFVVTGAWVGTLTAQRSFDSPDFGFEDVGTPITANGTISIDDQDDNVIVYYRVKMTAYTSGQANVRTVYDQAGGTGICRITSIDSSTVARMSVLQDFVDVEATRDWLPGAWGQTQTFPSAVTIFDGRLFWSADDRFWGTVSDDYFSFSNEGDADGDSGSIQRDVATGDEFGQVNWLMPLQRLILGTSGSEISARSSSFDEPLTPTNVTLKPASTFGSYTAAPVRMHSRGMFIDLAQRKIIEMSFSLDAQDYVGNDMTRFNEDLFESDIRIGQDGFLELAVQRAPEPYIWAVRTDGVACVMLYNPAEEIRAWTTVSTGTAGLHKFESIAVVRGSVEDDVYAQVIRTIDGVSTNMIEKFARHSDIVDKEVSDDSTEIQVRGGVLLCDSYVTFSGAGGGGQVISGLDHLEGADVLVIGRRVDSNDVAPLSDLLTVSSGSVTLPIGLTGTCAVGLPYEGRYKSAKLAYGAQKGTALTMKKRVTHLGMALLDTHPDAIRVGPQFGNDDLMDELPRIRSDMSELELGENGQFTRALEEWPFPFPGEWDTDSRVCIKIQRGYTATLSAIVIGMDTAES